MTASAQIGMAILKPRFLIALALVLGFTVLALNQKDKIDHVYHKLPTLRSSRQPNSRTTSERLAQSELAYQRTIHARQEQLKRSGYGTSEFKPWHPFMPWWWYFHAAFTCPHDVERIGFFGDGGKWVCGISLLEAQKERPCVVYSLGVQGDSSFEAEIMKRTNCEVWAFDASVDDVAGEAKGNPRIHFNKVFIGSEDKIDEEGKTWKTLKTIMKENKHDWIDILKMDIEGSEYGAMNAMMHDFQDQVLPFSQLQVELHLEKQMPAKEEGSFPTFLGWFESLEKKGLRPFWNELNIIPVFYYGSDGFYVCEFSFINTKGDHLLVQD